MSTDVLVNQVGADGLMSLATAVGFLNAAIAILLAHRSNTRLFWASNSFAGVVTLTGGMVIMGYIFSPDAVYEIEAFSTMALPTASGFVVLGASLLSMASTKETPFYSSRFGIPSAIFRGFIPMLLALPVLIGWGI